MSRKRLACIVTGQVGSPAPPITVPYLREVVASSSFYLYLASLAAFLALLVLWAQPRFARRFAWVYLAERGPLDVGSHAHAACHI